MNARTEDSGSPLDTVKLVLAGAVVLAGVFSFYYFQAEQPTVVRALGVLASLVLAILIAYQSTQGRTFWRFVQNARVELRKVVWPNRQETTTTTITVMIFAMLLGVFFWLLDMFLAWVTRTATGLGG